VYCNVARVSWRWLGILGALALEVVAAHPLSTSLHSEVHGLEKLIEDRLLERREALLDAE